VPDDLRPAYEAWLRRTFGSAAERAGLLAKRDDTLDSEIERAWLVSSAAWFGRDPKLVGDATKLAQNWRTLPASIRRSVLTIGVDASPALFEQTMTRVAAERDRARRLDMLWALASVRDPERQARALRLILDTRLDLNDTLQMLSAGRNSPGTASRARAQAYFREHQAALLRGLRQGGAVVAWEPFVALFTGTCDADQRDAITAYVRATFGSLPGARRILAQNLEQMDQCIAQRKLLTPAVRAWLTGLGP
jgi:alanyl aminopeptidase